MGDHVILWTFGGVFSSIIILGSKQELMVLIVKQEYCGYSDVDLYVLKLARRRQNQNTKISLVFILKMGHNRLSLGNTKQNFELVVSYKFVIGFPKKQVTPHHSLRDVSTC